MRRIFVSICFLAIALPCYAQGDKAKLNTLTPNEIADGWILLFDGETTFGLTLLSLKGAPQRINGDFLDLTGVELSRVLTTNQFSEFELSFEYRSFGANAVVGLESPDTREIRGRSSLFLLKQAPDWLQATLRVEAGKVMPPHGILAKWDQPARIRFEQNQKSGLHLRNIKLRPLNTQSLFNAKDLTGWKEFPGKKSKFAVIDNAINVKDGPGDLQTVGKYKDFILQLECISNGKHLNSGIFFRCRDNEYQNGYEAQIRNQFTEKPEQKYLIEEYDPKTNKLIGKKEIMSTAFDYGTGAIYRRVPARKQMSKDGEWFGMTVVAHGNHLATWVNGVQVADWYDNRPKSDNARTGCKLEAGHISIQGHDPTTDLSFKNFRIAEFK